MGPVYSQDNLDADVILSESGSDSALLQEVGVDDSVLEESDNNYELQESPKSFSDLQKLINQASGNEIVLTSDYTYNPAKDSGKNGISISRSLTIIGNNHTVDGNKLSRIFQISGSNVVIKNLNLVNGYTLDYGGAITWTGSRGKLLNSTLTDNFASIGGAIYWGGSNGLAEDNTIVNNNAISAAGAIYEVSGLKSINNVFEGNSPVNEKDVMNSSDLDVYKATYKPFEFDGMVFDQKCINQHRHSVTGYNFVISNMSIVVNNLDGTNVADYLKIAFAYNLYESGIVWTFTDSRYMQSTSPKVKKVIELYNQGVRVPDTFIRQVDEDTYEQYTFKALFSLDTSVQNLFLHNVTRRSIIRNLTVEKISLDPSVVVGNTTRFLIKLTNTGEFELNNPYVIEYDFEGLTYDSYIDESEDWDYNGNNQWTYHGTLAEGESSSFVVVFIANKVGNFTNYIVGGVNDKNISYANNTTSVEDIEYPDETDENDTEDNTEDVDVESNEDSSFDKNETQIESNSESSVFSVSKNVAGNPLMLLFVSLLLLIIPLNRKN